MVTMTQLAKLAVAAASLRKALMAMVTMTGRPWIR
jgi:hypothetical protein